jgi:hypothetical protein
MAGKLTPSSPEIVGEVWLPLACIRIGASPPSLTPAFGAASSLQLNEGCIVLVHWAPRRSTRPIERAESCQVFLHADTADNWRDGGRRERRVS